VADATTADGQIQANDANTGSDAPPAAGVSVLYQVGVSAASSAYIGCTLSIKNSGVASPAVADLKVRYYYTDEVHLSPMMTINWSHISTSGPDVDLSVTSAFGSLVPAATGADSYVEFGFSSSHPALATGESAVFAWQMQGPDPSKDVYTQTNDYSFDSSKTTPTSWDHVVILQNGTVIWGTVP
jgi:hypothetical protein